MARGHKKAYSRSVRNALRVRRWCAGPAGLNMPRPHPMVRVRGCGGEPGYVGAGQLLFHSTRRRRPGLLGATPRTAGSVSPGLPGDRPAVRFGGPGQPVPRGDAGPGEGSSSPPCPNAPRPHHDRCWAHGAGAGR
ncbi:hypothetical protein STAFG_8730 [Streptomyces afghaniensis 772]|uniref:Uncharacterized protein n=1 Tax=Streptomyces afghaniensis 772 TaxID=1283301 RepID=S4MFE5_9ACTN|nr:hypothetical protein STAFG_8730 [Streptomyces afghaniensis 772]